MRITIKLPLIKTWYYVQWGKHLDQKNEEEELHWAGYQSGYTDGFQDAMEGYIEGPRRPP